MYTEMVTVYFSVSFCASLKKVNSKHNICVTNQLQGTDLQFWISINWTPYTYVSMSGPHVISGFHCEVDENCAILRHYTSSSGNSLLTFQGQDILDP